MRNGYYCVDGINGVHFIGERIEDPEIDIMRPLDFLAAVSTTQKAIYTWFDESRQEIFNEIETQYGIH